MQFVKHSQYPPRPEVCDYCGGHTDPLNMWRLEPWSLLLHRFCARRFLDDLNNPLNDTRSFVPVIARRFVREGCSLDTLVPVPFHLVAPLEWPDRENSGIS